MLTAPAETPIRPADWPHNTRVAPAKDLRNVAAKLTAGADGVILQREIPNRVLTWLADLPAATLPEGRFVLDPTDIPTCLSQMFEAKSVSHCPERAWLSDDVARLAMSVSRLARKPWVRLRLEVVTNNACSKFHVDNVLVRLICTYRGPGTHLRSDDNETDPERVIATGAPIFLKGKQWQQTEDITLRHRSPPIEGTGLTRWLLVLEGCDGADVMPEYDEIYRDLNL